MCRLVYLTSLSFSQVFIKFSNAEGEELDYKLEMALDTSVEHLTELINKLLLNDDKMPYNFFFENF